MTSGYIPNYDLYGEPRDPAATIGIHIEDIKERSRGQNWVIKPHRHGKLFQVLCIFDGESNVQLDDKLHYVDGWSLITIPSGVVHSFSFKPDSQGVVVTLSEDAIATILNLQAPEYLRSVYESADVVDMKASEEFCELLQKYLALMRYEFTTANRAKYTAVLLLANLFLITIKRQVDYCALGTTEAPSHLRIFNAFRRLIEKKFRAPWKVSDYANALNVSTSTLNRMCHVRFGTSAKAVLNARSVTESKRSVFYTKQPLDQISYYLGYKDPAYFSRVFKKLEHVSPSEYRKERQL